MPLRYAIGRKEPRIWRQLLLRHMIDCLACVHKNPYHRLTKKQGRRKAGGRTETNIAAITLTLSK